MQNQICPCDGGCPVCSGTIQPKLKVSSPDDKYEKEADRIADEIMCMPEGSVQRPAERSLENIENNAQKNNELFSEGGCPLSEQDRKYFEPRFGFDFGMVRVHSGENAAKSADDLGAKAFTIGNNIVFGRGLYNLSGRDSKKLMGHELVHVVQQTAKLSPISGRFSHVGKGLIQCLPEETGTFPFTGLPTKCERSSEKESPSGPPARDKYRVRVCTDTNELFIEELAPPHKQVFHTLVVTGGEKTPTPHGTYRLKIWEKDYITPAWGAQSCTKWSQDPLGRNVFGPYIIRFKGSYYIHGTVGPGISPITLNGIAMGNMMGSHGCIRMANADIFSLHDGLLRNPQGTKLIIGSCKSPPEADYELVLRGSYDLEGLEGEERFGFESEYRLFTPTLLARRIQPFLVAGIGTSGIQTGAGTSFDPFSDLSLFLAGKVGVKTEWFHSLEIGGGVEAGWAFGKSRSLRLGIGYEIWEELTPEKKREHLLNLFLGTRF